ncbi:MAG: acyltransferase family protein [Acidimicrobiales bacterium]
MQLNPAKVARPVHADGRRYVPAIDGLRVLAAWGVISAHVGSEFSPSHKLVAYYGAAAYPALIVFFTISGFLVYRPFARAALTSAPRPASDRSTKFWVYLLRRVLRIFPLYWAILTVAVLWNGPGNLHSFTDWVQAIFLLPIPDPMRLLAGPLGIAMWTLAIELPFYVVVPVFASGVKKGRARFAPASTPFQAQVAALVALIAGIFGLGVVFGGELAFPVMSLPVGMLFAVLETRQALTRRRYPVIRALADNWWLCIAGYVALVFVAARLALDAYDVPGVTDPYAHIRNLYFPLQMSMALLLFVPVAFGRRRSLMVRLMASPPLQILAPLTYGIYLWHVPLIHHTKEWFGEGLLGFPFIGTTGFGMPTIFMSIGLAMVTFVVVELPAAKLRSAVDRWSRGQTSGTGGPADDEPEDEERSELGGGADRLVEELPDRMWRPDLKAPVYVHNVGEGDDAYSDAEAPLDDVVIDGDHPADEREPALAAAGASAATEVSGLGKRALSRAGEDANPQLRAVWCEPIDGFRAICACLAVIGHTFLATGIIPFAGVLHVLGILVALFFAISAFVLYQPFIEADVRGLPRPAAIGFWVRRLLRIYPLFAFALTAYLLILPEVRPDNWWGYVRLYLFLQIFGRELSGFKGMPSAWYLCNEVIFYFLIPLLALAAARWSTNRRIRKPADRLRAHIMIGWGMVFFGPLLRTLIYAADVPAPTSLPLSHLEFFGFGIIVAGYTVGARMGIAPPSLFRWVRRNTRLAYALVLVPALMLAGIAERWGDGTGLWQDGNMEDRLRFFPYLMAVFLLMAAAAIGPRNDPANRWLSHKRFKPLSALALHIYLWHQLVLGVLNLMLPHGLGELDFAPRWIEVIVICAAALFGTISVAWVTQPLTDWPYERYRQVHGLLRRGAGPSGASRPAPAGPRPASAG